jgi:hypothetical protein
MEPPSFAHVGRGLCVRIAGSKVVHAIIQDFLLCVAVQKLEQFQKLTVAGFGRTITEFLSRFLL